MSSEERECLHDLANKITIAQGKIRRVLNKRSEDQEADLQKADLVINDAIVLIKKIRQLLIAKEA
ncbi:MAG: hypothetical protein KDD58_07435 [Bdellovibrionales bacterium]|nr:hypothetical protein [Bdellovibrionales bacterium]